LTGLILPLTISAGTYQAKRGEDTITIYYEGLVPCGKEVLVDASKDETTGKWVGTPQVVQCQFCHFFVMIDGIIDFLLRDIVPYLAVFMIVVAGVMLYFGGGKPELISKGKTVMKAVIIGLFLIYGSFIIVGTFLSILGVSEWTGLASDQWFTVNCQITVK